MCFNREVDPLGADLRGVHRELFVCPVGDDASGAKGGDISVNVGDQGGRVVLWEGSVGVGVVEVGRGMFNIVLFAEDHHLVTLVRLSDDDRGIALECPEGGPEVARKVVSEDGGGQLGESLVGGIKALFYEGWGRWLVGEGPVVGGDVRDAKVYRVRLGMFRDRRGWAE